jgi:membrane protein implicated in regulation of membrane protease activity
MGWPEWLEDWQAWLSLAVLLGALELFSLDLFLLMLAGGAVLGMVAAIVGLPVVAQVLVALAGSLAALALVRPGVVKRLHGGPTLVLGHDALVGRQGVVIERVSSHGGQVRIGGDVWTARPYDEDLVIESGATVDIFAIKGATALVHEVPSLDP